MNERGNCGGPTSKVGTLEGRNEIMKSKGQIYIWCSLLLRESEFPFSSLVIPLKASLVGTNKVQSPGCVRSSFKSAASKKWAGRSRQEGHMFNVDLV